MRIAMLSFRAIAITLSLAVHGSLGYALIANPPMSVSESFDAGTGNDAVFVEQGIAIEGLAKFGDAIETIEAAEVTPVATETPPPVEEVKEIDERRDTITSEASSIDDNIVKTEEEPQPVVEPPPLPEVQPVEQPQQVAVVSEQSSGESKLGSINTTARTQYLGKLRDVLEKSKINPRSRLAGTVWVKFKIGPNGDLISREITSSSGSKVLDDAAVAALDRAAPFPPMPNDVAQEAMVVSVPFKFITR